MYHSLDTALFRGLEDIPGACNIGRTDVFRLVERQCSRRVNDDISTAHVNSEFLKITDVALNSRNAPAFRIIERNYIVRNDLMSVIQKVANHVYAQEPGAARNKISHIYR